MADAIHGNTQIGATKMEIIAAMVQKELKFKAVLAKYFTDVSAFAVKGAKSITFPKVGSFSVAQRASATAGDATVITATGDKLDLNIPAYIAYIIDQNDNVQSVLDWDQVCAERAGAAHARYLDEQLILGMDSYAGFDLALGADITRDAVLDARANLLKSDADPSELTLFISVAQEKAMLKIAEFTQAQIYGTSNVPTGMIGSVYGIPVVMHNGLADAQSFMAAKSGLAFGFQQGIQASEQMANEYGSQAKRVAVDQLFGLKGMQLGEKSVAAGKSPLIVNII